MNTATRFHNLPAAALADALGAAACPRKLAEEEERELKAELKRRRLDQAVGERFAVLRSSFVVWDLLRWPAVGELPDRVA